jgi:hypothetical protein
MNRRLFCAMFSATCLLGMAATATAGPYDVTFQVPLNLTGLSPDITKVQVDCTITSAALPVTQARAVEGSARGFTEPPASGGQVVSTVTVVVPITTLDTSGGKTTAHYSCRLTAFSQTLGSYGKFDPAASVPAFRVSPVPADITGTFTW